MGQQVFNFLNLDYGRETSLILDTISITFEYDDKFISYYVIDCMCSYSTKRTNKEIYFDKALVNFKVNNDNVTLTLTTPNGNPLVSYVQENLCIKDNLYGYYNKEKKEFIQLGEYWQNIEKGGDDIKPCSDFEPPIEPTPSPPSNNTNDTTNSTQPSVEPTPSPSSNNTTYINNSTNITNINNITIITKFKCKFK